MPANNPSNFPDQDKTEDSTECVVRKLLIEICDSAVDKVDAVMVRDKSLTAEERYLRTTHRRVSVLDEEVDTEAIECRNNFVNLHRRAVSECAFSDCVLDENDNKDYSKPQSQPVCSAKEDKKSKDKDKKKKKLSFASIFKKDRNKSKESREEEETHDNLAQLPVFHTNTLGKSKKFASALELSQRSLQRTPSLIKRIVHNIGEDSSSFLKRSFSFREVNKKQDKVAASRGKLEKMNQEWKQSLQSLVETDIRVSYNDLSFIDYDALNDINYEPVELRAGTKGTAGHIGRTQSMIEKRSPNLRKPPYQRLSSATDRLSTTSLPAPSPAVSLPSLHHLNQENVERLPEDSTSVPRYRRRQESINSDDGGRRPSSYGTGSFRSAGSGYSKLKRHNACRQKVRDPALLIELRNSGSDTDRAVSGFNLFIDSLADESFVHERSRNVGSP
ncbi:hypothetical protein JTB14_019935 [Gonioctena quinquepunctata]|nr:hypothetical protein JTB14_019935 [Gonioctena quinquepunctata]